MTVIHGGHVLTPEGMVPSTVSVVDGLLALGAADGGETVDVSGMTVVPGLIDLQVNGGWGHDFTADPASIWDVGARLPETGVTSFLPTIVTSLPEAADRFIAVLLEGPPEGYRGAAVLGGHIEGPWISPDWHGAHDRALLTDPDPALAARWAEPGVIRVVTMAPELDGAPETAKLLAEAGVLVSAGHSGADYATATAALGTSWGAVTHLFNQMSPFQHREPGMVGAALDSDRPCGLIVDGLHSHPGAVQLAWRSLGAGRLVLVTDAMAALGLGPGSYLLGEQRVVVDESGPRTLDGRLAGSVLTMAEAVANLTAWTDADLEDAVLCATSTPAALLGLHDRGVLRDGARADLTVLSPDHEVTMTMVAGEILFHRGDD
jgi:N-acetylglucosamine-6-phosphate deacetylase